MADNQILVDSQQLLVFMTEMFEKAGLRPEDAAFHAQALVDTNLWGIDSHGILRAPAYVGRLRKNAMNPQPHTHVIQGGGALEVLHGDDGPGFLVARDAMKRAVELARQYNVGIVGAIHSNHFGAAGIYARMAAEEGMIGISMTNVTPNIVAPGGSKPVTGNNPIAFAIPTYAAFPMVLDLSLSSVAGGKILLASKKGEKIPLDWATDKQGRPTDDPDVAFAGFLLPMGSFKGLGLSYVIDILTGLITGGVFGDEIKSMYKYPDEPSLTCHMMIAINVETLLGREEMKQRMDSFYQRVKNSPMWEASGEMFLPGEIEYRLALRRQKEGLPLPPKLYEELLELAKDMGMVNVLLPLSFSAAGS